MAHFKTALTVKAIALAPQFGIVRILTNNLDDALKAAEKRQTALVQANQQFTMRKWLRLVRNNYRHLSRCRVTA